MTWVLILVSLLGEAAPLRVGSYDTEAACKMQALVMVENLRQSAPNLWVVPWRGVCVPVQIVTP